ncbi:unnamed protein product [Euphydryas editha]|uniref:Uncharacterized protein n=1 Tax=Euphydryas editha TaxID=104508 RepID=A0AAU9UC04_EUPED|nr:unnamed protein product [Euphydryas editha]
MASTCIHDNRAVCASSPDGCSRRSFLDQCDMYEYNCDYGTRYLETYILFCSELELSSQNNVNLIETSQNCDQTHGKLQQKPKQIITFDESYNETSNNDLTNPLETIIKKKSDESYVSHEKSHTLFNVTDKRATDINDQKNYTKAILKATSQYNSQVLLTKRLTDKPLKLRNYTSSYLDRWNYSKYCCNRPSTWETTTDIRNILIVDNTQNENENPIVALANKVNRTTLKHIYHFNVTSPKTTTKISTTRRVTTEVLPDVTKKILLTKSPKKKNSNAIVLYFDIIKCDENTPRFENYVTKTIPTINKSEYSDYLSFSEEDNRVLKLQSKRVSIDICGRPNTWVTTQKGETRDFYRILNIAQNKK